MLTPLEILDRINSFTLATADNSKRKHLGASEVGGKCLRATFYKWRWCGQEQFDPRMLRLFQRGHREEAVIVELLRGAGFQVEVPTPGDMERFQFSDFEGHFRGTCDGVALPPGENEWVLLELKTWKSETKAQPSPGFDALKRYGVAEAEPKHLAQIHVYQGYLGLKRSIYIGQAKNNDELHIERIAFDELQFSVNQSKASTVINSPATSPPEKISYDPNTYTCRFCAFRKICHEGASISTEHTHCRNCIHASPAAAGTWECGAGHAFGTLCGDYRGITGPA